MTCNQCNRPAIMELGGHPLCVDHYVALQRVEIEQNNSRAAMMNFLMDSMDESVGIRSNARFRMSQPIVHTGATTVNRTVNNLNIDNSVIGVLNTGTVSQLNSSLSALQGYNGDLSNNIRTLVEAIGKSNDLQIELKKELIEHISFLAGQIFAPKDKRNTSVSKTVLQSIEKGLAGAANLTVLWQAIAPAIIKFIQ